VDVDSLMLSACGRRQSHVEYMWTSTVSCCVHVDVDSIIRVGLQIRPSIQHEI